MCSCLYKGDAGSFLAVFHFSTWIRTGGASSFPVHNKFHTHSLSSLLDLSVSLLLAVATTRTSNLLCISSGFVDVVRDQTIQNLTAPSDMRDLGLLPLARPICPLIG